MRHRNKNMIISLLLCCVLVMTIGYAIYNKRLNIDGVSNISSVYDVRFTNITSTTSGLATNMSLPSYTNTTATFSADLKAPGDEIIYKITVSNLGTLDAKLLLVTMSDAQNPAIDFKYTGVKVGDILPAGQSTIVTVTVKFDKSITDEPEVMDSDLTIKLDYGQTDETTVDEIVNTSSYLVFSDYSSENWLDGPLTKDSIESVSFTTTSVVPSEAGDNYWDASNKKDGSIMAWYYDNDSDGYFEVTIGQYNGVKANPNSEDLFKDLTFLTTVDFENFNTSDVTNMSGMFYNASSLQVLDISMLDTSSVTDMSAMFQFSNLTELDLSTFDVSKVNNMNNMFYGITNLQKLNLSTWNTGNVKNMGGMFDGLKKLESLDVSYFDMSNVTNVGYMFKDVKLDSLDLSKWNDKKISFIAGMFWGAEINNLNVDNFNLSNVSSFDRIFYNFKGEEELDLSTWDTSSVTNMYGLFMSSGFKTIYVSDKWNNDAVKTSTNMFYGSTKLKGAVSYSADNANDVTFANYTTGYFTYKAN